MDETKQLEERLLKAVGEGLTPLREQIEAEVKKLGEETAETKAAWEKVNERLDDIEVKTQKAIELELRGKREGEPSAEFKAYVEVCRKGIGNKSLSDETKALIEADDTLGGYLAPEEISRELIKGVVEFSPVRQAARVMSTSAQSVKIPKRTATFAAQWVAETGTRSETTGLTYGMEEIPTHELYALVDVGNALLEDNQYDLEGELQMEFAEQFGKAEGAAFCTGNAVTRPEGFITNTSVTVVSTATNDVLAADDLIELYYTPKTAYAKGGAWLLNRGILKAVRKMKDTTNQYVWQAGLAGLAPATILDAPYYEAVDMASAVADQAKVAAFGDWQRGYRIVDRIQLVVQRDPYTQATAGATRFIARRRVGGQVVNTEALAILKIQ